MKDSNIILRISGEKKALWQGKAKVQGVTLTKYIVDTVDGNVYTNEKVGSGTVYTKPILTKKQEGVFGKMEKDGFIKEATKEECDLDILSKEITWAIERGDPGNWAEVKGLVKELGYEWDGTTKCLSKDGRVVWRGYSK